MSLHVGWRNFWWFNTGLIAASFLMVVFMFPETKWHRLHPDEILNTALQPRSDKNNESDEAVDAEKVGSQVQTETLQHTSTQNRDIHLGKGTPSKQQWKIYQSNPHPFKTILYDLWIPWKLFAFPIVEFSSFVVSWSCSSFLTINLTQSQNFAAPPYKYNSQSIGFMNFAILIGAGIGLATAGPLSDWVSARATRKNRGIREPEMRLPAMSKSCLITNLVYRNLRERRLTQVPVPYVLIMILGNFIVAFGYEQKWPWEAIVIIGYTCAGIQVAALPAIVTTYSVDSYKPVAGSLMVSITVNKNVWGYGFSEFITPWALKSGFVPPIMTNMSLITLWCLFGILFYFYGKTFRRWSKNDSVHKL